MVNVLLRGSELFLPSEVVSLAGVCSKEADTDKPAGFLMSHSSTNGNFLVRG